MSSYLEAIAALGNGSLHPGGFSHTLEILRRFSISPEDIVLDIGCGTGRTACHIAAAYGAHVFALDNSGKMLAKAKARAARDGVEVHFIHGDILDMPFRDEVADLVFIESVLIFLPVPSALKECFRVLKRNGILVDVELLAAESLPPTAAEQIKAICGLPQIPTFQEWIGHFKNVGFARAVVRQNRFPGLIDNLKEILYKDPHQAVSSELMTNWELSRILSQYGSLIMRNRRHLGFGNFIAQKG